MTLKLKIYCCFILIVFSNCRNDEKYSGREYSEFDRDGWTVKDSSITKTEKYRKIFSDKGSLIQEGIIFQDSLKKGVWKSYGSNSETEFFEYFIVGNKSILNRSWFTKKNGDTIPKTGFFQFKIPDTAKIGDTLLLKILNGYPVLSKEAELELYIPELDKGPNLNETFSNQKEVVFDTIKSLKYDPLNKNTEGPINRMIMLKFIFTTKGNKTIRGILKENEFGEPPFRKKEREMYLEKRIYIKDTV